MSATAPAIAENILEFGRTLRAAGLPIGLSSIHEAVTAAALVGPDVRSDFYWALRSALVKRHDQASLFDQAFELFWTRQAEAPPGETGEASRSRTRNDIARRLEEVLRETRPRETRRREIETAAAAFRYAATETIAHKDFASMSAAEIDDAVRAVQSLALPQDERRTRRLRSSRRGAVIDWRGALRRALRTGGDLIDLPRRERRMESKPIILLIDISGSMEAYARILLAFAHALLRRRPAVSVFLFGTQLTNVTRLLRHRDVDEALARVGAEVTDWSGGTRIGESFERFNRRWARRVLTRSGHVILMTDGLDRAGGEGLAKETARLQRNCDRLIWLNPLLRFDAFEPKAAGVRAILPYVDAFRPVHNLASLAQLVRVLTSGE